MIDRRVSRFAVLDLSLLIVGNCRFTYVNSAFLALTDKCKDTVPGLMRHETGNPPTARLRVQESVPDGLDNMRLCKESMYISTVIAKAQGLKLRCRVMLTLL